MAPSTSDPDPDELIPLLARAEAMVNITLDDTSPFITYSDGWGIQSSQDPDLDYYLQETYHGTETVGSNATIVFSGSGVYLYGSMGPDHGNFEISVNGARQTFSGYATTPQFQQCIFSSMLDATYNEIILINIGGSSGNYMDLDYIITTVPENTTFPAQPALPPITPSAGFPSYAAFFQFPYGLLIPPQNSFHFVSLFPRKLVVFFIVRASEMGSITVANMHLDPHPPRPQP
ncbi:hypothetical protein CALCODRAFT_508749 [Calocera cornea HHB12733]|uniref:Uncharacterized protein n=1 Tax=Calocera cornea HHB12733 TaxID=1353952 RepID=A0A165G3G3_9BASI|nr:hypothetical protein CALCODRAFT_508749 [Calocera cornea HHB12733]